MDTIEAGYLDAGISDAVSETVSDAANETAFDAGAETASDRAARRSAAAGRSRWEERCAAAERSGRVRDADYTTLSGTSVDPVYGPGPVHRVNTRSGQRRVVGVPHPAGALRRGAALLPPAPAGRRRSPSRPIGRCFGPSVERCFVRSVGHRFGHGVGNTGIQIARLDGVHPAALRLLGARAPG